MKKETNFKKMLEKFDEAGNSASCGKWSIDKGGYALWWEIYYGGQCVLRCIAGEVEIEPVFDLFDASRKSTLFNILMLWDKELKFSTETADVICKARRYNLSQMGGDCPVDCPYSGDNADGICGAECQECGGELYLTHDDRVYCTDCGYVEEPAEAPADDSSEGEESAEQIKLSDEIYGDIIRIFADDENALDENMNTYVAKKGFFVTKYVCPEYGETMTFNDCVAIAKEHGFTKGVFYIMADAPLEGKIYQYANCYDDREPFVSEYGTTQGYA